MAGNHVSQKSRGSVAVKTRPSLPRLRLSRPLALALVAVLALTALLVTVTLSARSRRARAETAAPAASVKTPAAAAPSGREESSSLPAAMQELPAATSPELALRAVIRRDGFPMLSWNIDQFVTDDQGRMTYTGEANTLTGIDVSEHQADIDWKKVAADGIDFAMLRLGYRGSTAGGLYIDEYFEKNLAGAAKAGVPVGVYFYSQAVTVEEAREEAEFVLEHLRGQDISFPVVFDWEIVGGRDARTYTVSRRTLCDCAQAFCDTVAQAGYQPMIYFTQYLGYRKYILRNLTDYAFWYAEYDPQPRIAFDFDMWQYSETGRVSGIDGEVDLNILFVR